MIDQAARYRPALRFVPVPADGVRVLEVGCGTQGVCRHAAGTYFGVDLAFSDYSDRPAPVHPRLRAVRADALRLPFPDGAFDCVLSLDLLEHLEAAVRGPAVREMLRVARRRVVVGCPVADSWDRWERRLLGVHRRLRRAPPGWLAEHRERGLPMRSEVHALLDTPGWRGRAVESMNCAVYFAVLLVQMTPLRWLTARIVGNPGPRGPNLLARAAGRVLEGASFGRTARTLLVLDRDGGGGDR